jgi:gamma-glutamylcyclotransferase (GGCT)/AIG2-like uncharacterized protein YtfP
MPSPAISYFAYGSNLDPQQMTSRCPGHRVVGPAFLPGYRLAFQGNGEDWGGAVATLEPDPRGTVWGVVFELTAEDLVVLDRYEGCRGKDDPASLYDRRDFELRLAYGGSVTAIAYVMRDRPEGKPSKKYLSAITRGASSHQLPVDYIERLAACPTAD